MSAVERFLAIPELVQEVCQYAYSTTLEWRRAHGIRRDSRDCGARYWLAELATTCKALREPAQKATFRHVSRYDYGKDATVYWKPVMSSVSSTPRLGRYLTELWFGGDGASNDMSWHAYPSLPAELVKASGNALRYLSVGDLPGGNYRMLVDAVLDFAPRLRTLQLGASNGYVGQFLNGLPAVQHLHLNGVDPFEEGVSTTFSVSALHSLDFVACFPTHTSLGALLASSKHSLHTMSFTSFPGMALKELLQILSELAVLVNLTICHWDEDGEDQEDEVREDDILLLITKVPTLRVLDTGGIWGSKKLLQDGSLAKSQLEYIRFACIDDFSAADIEEIAGQDYMKRMKGFYMRMGDWGRNDIHTQAVAAALQGARQQQDDFLDRNWGLFYKGGP